MESLYTLVIAAQSGNLDAFSMLVEQFQGMAYAIAYTMLGDAQLAEDAAQEAFIEAYLNLPKLREAEAFPGWFRRIVLRQGDRLVRRKQLITVPLEPTLTFDIALDDLNPALIVESREIQGAVRRAIGTLSEHERIVIQLFYGNGYTLKDIANFLEVPITTIKKRLHDARKHLRSTLMHTIRSTLREQHICSDAQFPVRIRLLIAVRLNDLEMVTSLIKHNPMLVNTKLEQSDTTTKRYSLTPAVGHTALHEAAEHGHLAIINLLIDYGANINAKTRSGITPLHLATSANQLDAVKRLLIYGANVDARMSSGLTPLHWAAMKGYKEIAGVLLSNSATVNVQGQSGRTPLHWAALKGYAPIVSQLIQYCAAKDVQDELGRTPFDWAVVRGHNDIAYMLQHRTILNIERMKL